MAAWGAMAAVIAGGARIAAERAIGWNRQLRITPLPARTYFADQGRSPATRWPWSASRCCTWPALASACDLGAGRLAGDDRAACWSAWCPSPPSASCSATCSPSTRWARRWAASPPCSPCSAGPGARSASGGVMHGSSELLPVVLAGAGRADGLGGEAWPPGPGWSSPSGPWSLGRAGACAYRRDTGGPERATEA